MRGSTIINHGEGQYVQPDPNRCDGRRHDRHEVPTGAGKLGAA